MLRRVNLWLLNVVLLGFLQGCGGCGDDEPPAVSSDRDGEVEEDASFTGPDTGPPPVDVPDASDIFPGEPPPELEGEQCAAHTNKIYELTTTPGDPVPAQLAVDRLSAHFGMTFMSSADDLMCSSGVGFAELYGPPGSVEAEPMIAYDECTLIEQAAIARGDDAWLLAITDNRMEARDLWVHAFDPESGDTIATHRITENMAAESSVALLSIERDRTLIVWTETAFDSSGTALRAQFLSGEGEPTGEPVELAEASTAFYSGMSMALLGDNYIGLVYRKEDASVFSAVLEVLSIETAEADREPWVLTAEAGFGGSVDIASDSRGAGVVYTIWQGTSRQVWFQALGLDGRALPVMMANQTGGPSEPNSIVGTQQPAVDVSVAKLATGFVVAYRALPSPSVPQPRIRVHFLDRRGEIIGEGSVALAAMTGGQTALESAFDGRLILSWSDSELVGDAGFEEPLSTLRALVVPCGR
jgi:hypothetical protein